MTRASEQGRLSWALSWISAWLLQPSLVCFGFDCFGFVWFSSSPVWVWSHGLSCSWEGGILYKHWSWAQVYREIIARMQMLKGAPCFEIPKNQLLTLCV